jgi:hypothetical protein
MTHFTSAILCKIAQFLVGNLVPLWPSAQIGVRCLKSEQLRPAMTSGLSDHKSRDEYFFSLFQMP